MCVRLWQGLLADDHLAPVLAEPQMGFRVDGPAAETIFFDEVMGERKRKGGGGGWMYASDENRR